jgi:hypothetical protein
MGATETASIGTRPLAFAAPISVAAEVIAATHGAVVDSSTDDDDVALIHERLGDPAFLDPDAEEDDFETTPDDEGGG